MKRPLGHVAGKQPAVWYTSQGAIESKRSTDWESCKRTVWKELRNLPDKRN